MISNEFYEGELSSILLPATLVATSISGVKRHKGGSWCERDRRDLRHDYWNIRTADPEKDRQADRYVWLGDSLDFRHGWTGGVTPLHDALTLRMVCLEVLKGNGVARAVAALQTAKIMAQLEWLTRWRNVFAVRRWQDVTPDDFERFVEEASTSDITDLVPLAERLDILLDDPTYTLPIYAHGKKYRLNWHEFASTLGIDRWSLGHSLSFKRAFDKRAPFFLERMGVPPAIVNFYVAGGAGRASEERNPYQRLAAWDVLERLSINGLLKHDFLNFRPSHVVPGRVRPSVGKRTQVLLPQDLRRLLELSAVWVLQYGPYILQCLKERQGINPTGKRELNVPSIQTLMKRMDSLKPDGIPQLSLALAPSSPLHEGRLLLSMALQYLFVASSILIGGFAGRRRNETAAIRDNPIFVRHGVTYLTLYIEKTLQDVDGVPVPELVEHAVKLLHLLSDEARKKDGTKWLFQFYAELADGQNLQVDTNFGNHLLEFVNFCKLAPPAGEAAWKLNYHMLRKGFVIASFHGNLWGSFDATNRSLRHRDAGSSRHYMDDEETGAVAYLRNEVARLTTLVLAELAPEKRKYLEDAKRALHTHDVRRRVYNEGRQEFFVSMYLQCFDGIERPIGRGAALILDELQEMEERAYARIRISATPTNGPAHVRQDVVQQIKAAAANSFLHPVPGLPIYCTYRKGRNDGSGEAVCRRLENDKRAPWKQEEPEHLTSSSWPNFAFSGLHPCLDCSFCVLFNANQEEVQRSVKAREAAIPMAATAALAEDAQRYVDDLVRLITGAREAVDGKQRP
jgi:hypothetical protein